MLARRTGCPVFVGRDRVAQIRRIESEEGVALVVLDDGFQHLRLHRRIDLVAINPRRRLEENYCLPWGQLREPLSALKRATAVVLMNGSNPRLGERWRDFLQSSFPMLRIFEARRRIEGLWDGETRFAPSEGIRLAGFCGVADPDGFQEDLLHYPGSAFLRSYPDHFTYRDPEVRALLELKERHGANVLVTTDKDWFKAAPLFSERGEKLLSLRIRYDMPDEFWYFLDQRLETE
jgi:tetraacyldisaccharide 4'-kinase